MRKQRAIFIGNIMKVGISTASLFLRKHTEDALEFLSESGIETTEIFLETYREYNRNFGKILKEKKGNIDVHSVHVLTTQFEPQLYSINERAQEDSFNILDGAMQAAKEVDAKFYTFHGGALFKKTPVTLNFDRIGDITNRIIEVCNKYGVTLTYENVHWGYYNKPTFFTELKKRCPLLKGVLDIKQAAQSGYSFKEYIDDMAGNIETVHLSDVGENGKMCLPCFGTVDFIELFKRLKDTGFNGACLIECYKDDFTELEELKISVEKLKEIAYKIF